MATWYLNHAVGEVAGSAKVVLHRADEVDAGDSDRLLRFENTGLQVSLVLQSSQILVFRHDQLSFTYEGTVQVCLNSLARETWASQVARTL